MTLDPRSYHTGFFAGYRSAVNDISKASVTFIRGFTDLDKKQMIEMCKKKGVVVKIKEVKK